MNNLPEDWDNEMLPLQNDENYPTLFPNLWPITKCAPYSWKTGKDAFITLESD